MVKFGLILVLTEMWTHVIYSNAMALTREWAPDKVGRCNLKPALKAASVQRFILNCDEMLSGFAVDFCLCPYNQGGFGPFEVGLGRH